VSARRRSRPNASTGLLVAIAGAVLFAVNGTASKVVLQSGLSSLELVSVRSAGAAVVLLGLTALLRPSALKVSWRELRFLAVYGVTGIAMVQWLYFVAIARMPVGVALLFEYTAPLLVALWVRFVQGQPVRSRLWLGLACALGGLALVAELWKGMVLDPLGLVSALGAAAALAAYYLVGEHAQRQRDPISLMGYSFGFSAVLWAVVQPWWTFPFGRLGAAVELPGALPGHAPLGVLVLWIVVLGTVVPFLLVMLAIHHLGAARVGLVGMLEPVTAGVIAWVLLGESLSPLQVAGSVVVLVGIVLAETARHPVAVAARDLTASAPTAPLPGGVAP
jgi:drug/metabolite transporter (DMT)-like permease